MTPSHPVTTNHRAHMTLGFSTHWKNGMPTLFLQKIMYPYVAGIRDELPDLLPKIHTFRFGHRWRAGMKMHMVTGNRTKYRQQFNEHIPELQTCISVQPAMVCMHTSGIAIAIGTDGVIQRWLTRAELLLFAANDGFNSIEELQKWFFPKGYEPTAHPLVGQIIHWTDFRYSLLAPATAPEKEG